MDIDFHYYATYVAACFAGFPEIDALVIATSAQMIDENSRHVLVKDAKDIGITNGMLGFPDDFKIRYHADGPTIHTYRVQMTFQGLGDIGDSEKDTLSSIWPVYHFLPGNFSVNGQKSSERWSQSTLKASYAGNKKLSDRFEWVCRPHSPMAISLINNCRELIYDTSSQIYEHQLSNYLIGVTMHVFADTWGHQDFVGFGVMEINSRGDIDLQEDGQSKKAEVSYSFMDPLRIKLPTFIGNVKSYSPEVSWNSCDWSKCAPKILGRIVKSGAIGHGIVGHLPDHSSVIWRYKPAWSESEIIRNNPVEYYDAFVHLIWAMRCIRLNEPYFPIDVTSANISSKLDISEDKLLEVYKVIALKRDPWANGAKNLRVIEDYTISDTWDGMMYLHGGAWQHLITHVLGLRAIPEWIPGQSQWVVDAYETLQENKALKNDNWYTVQQFQSLDFFKFNIAAKFHYRFVKQQLLAFNKQLLGDWADGAAYADDFKQIVDSAPHQDKPNHHFIIKQLSDLQRKEKRREVNEGMTILIRDIEAADSLNDVYKVLETLIENVKAKGLWTYGLLNEKGHIQSSTALGVIKEITSTLKKNIGGDKVSSNINVQLQAALLEYETHKKKLFSTPGMNSVAVAKYLQERLIDSSDSVLRSYVLFLLGLSANLDFHFKHLGLKPLSKGTKLYTLIYNVYIKSSPIE